MDNPLDWSLMRTFLAVAETGSLSAAARQLGSSQPTVGRQINQIESRLTADLFHRTARGLDLTETGAALMAPARAMRDAMHQITLTAAGQVEAIAGTVRITASVATSTYHLPQIIAAIRVAEPNIAIELVPSDDSQNLLYREADIAVRMYRPTQLDLIAQHIGDIELGVFVAKSYVARRGRPDATDGFASHDFVGYDRDTSIIDGMNAAGLPVTREFFKTRVDDNIAYWEMVRAGCGIGFAQAIIGRADPEMLEIKIGSPLPVLPVWLTAHAAMRHTPRVRRVWEILAQGLKPLVS